MKKKKKLKMYFRLVLIWSKILRILVKGDVLLIFSVLIGNIFNIIGGKVAGKPNCVS